MRIISGKHKGRVIHPPKNLRARPTTDFAKENLFNVINSHLDIEGADILDLFSGTGSIGYEFASRGAGSVVAVEINNVHHNFIKNTAAAFGFDNLFTIKANSFLYIKSCRKKFDLIFADPPYDLDGIGDLPNLIFERGILHPGGWLILEHSEKFDFSDHPRFLQSRSYGSVHFSIFEEVES